MSLRARAAGIAGIAYQWSGVARTTASMGGRRVHRAYARQREAGTYTGCTVYVDFRELIASAARSPLPPRLTAVASSLRRLASPRRRASSRIDRRRPVHVEARARAAAPRRRRTDPPPLPTAAAPFPVAFAS